MRPAWEDVIDAELKTVGDNPFRHSPLVLLSDLKEKIRAEERRRGRESARALGARFLREAGGAPRYELPCPACGGECFDTEGVICGNCLGRGGIKEL